MIGIVAGYSNTSSFQVPSNFLVKGIIKVIEFLFQKKKVIEFPPVIPCNLFSWNPNDFCVILFVGIFF